MKFYCLDVTVHSSVSSAGKRSSFIITAVPGTDLLKIICRGVMLQLHTDELNHRYGPKGNWE